MTKSVAPGAARTSYGVRLAAWIEAHVPTGMSWRSVAVRGDVEPTRLIAWRKGTLPGLDQLALVADAFGVSRVDLLTAIGFLDPGATATTHIADVDFAIEADPSLHEHDRELLRNTRQWIITHHQHQRRNEHNGTTRKLNGRARV